MNINFCNITTKSYYRFIEFLSLLCGIDISHERFKQVILDNIEAVTNEDKQVKSLANSYLYILSNIKQPLSLEIIYTSYFLLTGKNIDKSESEIILSTYYYNNNTDAYNKAIAVHKIILNVIKNRKIEFAFIISNYILLKNKKGQLLPHPRIVNDYNTNLRIDDYSDWIFLFKQMEDRQTFSEGYPLPSKEDVIEKIKNISNTLKTTYKVKFLALYGSIVKNIQNESSDIDFLIDFDNNLIDYEKGLLKEKLIKYLKEELDERIDLVDFKHALKELNINEMEKIIVLIKEQ